MMSLERSGRVPIRALSERGPSLVVVPIDYRENMLLEEHPTAL